MCVMLEYASMRLIDFCCFVIKFVIVIVMIVSYVSVGG